MKNWSVRLKLLAAFSIVVAITLANSIMGWLELEKMEARSQFMLDNPLPGLELISEIESECLQDHAQTWRFIAEKENATRDSLRAKVQGSVEREDLLLTQYEKTITTPDDRQLFNTMRANRVAYLHARNAVLQSTNITHEAVTLKSFEDAWEILKKDLDAVFQWNRKAADNAMLDTLAVIRGEQPKIIGVSVLTLVATIVLALLLTNAVTSPLRKLTQGIQSTSKGDLTATVALDQEDEFGKVGKGFDHMVQELKLLIGQIQRSGVQVNTSITEMAATLREQQATVNEISATTAEIGATSKEISATSKELVNTMSSVADEASQTTEMASSGKDGLGRMEHTIGQILDASGSITNKLSILSEKAANIGSVVTTITKVADQTNLLSLNAAIEAEKAGEYGRGFSVVATEIRRLADQTSVATYDIEQMVKEMQSAVSAGVMGMDKFNEEVRKGAEEVRQISQQMNRIIEQVQGLLPQFESTKEAMQSQSLGAQQISEALGQLTETMQQTNESLRQTTAAIDQLTEASKGLQNGISRFST